jgi:hypothetical protein
MKIEAFDLPPTGNEVVDALRVIDAQAKLRGTPEESVSYCTHAIAEIGIDAILDRHYMVMSRKVLAKSLTTDESTRTFWGDGLILQGTLTNWSFLRAEKQGIDGVILEYFDTKLLGAETIDSTKLSRLVFQLPVIDIEFCVEVGN